MAAKVLAKSLFMEWWEYTFRSWRHRAPKDATLTFLCELGSTPYAITGSDGYELSDRWEEFDNDENGT
jgi:hypothetical protein